eukprot:Opistho-2@75679
MDHNKQQGWQGGQWSSTGSQKGEWKQSQKSEGEKDLGFSAGMPQGLNNTNPNTGGMMNSQQGLNSQGYNSQGLGGTGTGPQQGYSQPNQPGGFNSQQQPGSMGQVGGQAGGLPPQGGYLQSQARFGKPDRDIGTNDGL